MTPEHILGAWTLVSVTRYTDAGTDFPLGPKPTGLILYTPEGLMSAFVHKDTSQRWEGPLLAAYAGTWSIEGDIVRHAVLYNTEPERAGSTLIRHARFEDGLLVLQTGKKPGKRGLSWMDFAWARP